MSNAPLHVHLHTYTLYISQVWNDLEWTGLQNGLVFFSQHFFKGFYGWLEITVENNTNILSCFEIRWYHFNLKTLSTLCKESSLGPSINYVVSKLEIWAKIFSARIGLACDLFLSARKFYFSSFLPSYCLSFKIRQFAIMKFYWLYSYYQYY